jgi:hypothetical protein
MVKRFLVLSLGLLLIFVGCGKKAGQAKVETINGVAYIHCPGTPMHPETAVAFEEELSFSNKGEGDKILIYQPSWYAVSSQGVVFVSDSSEQNIKVFDPDGRYLRTIGAKGEGPGEFGSVGQMAALPDGRLLVLDYRARRTSLFDGEGNYKSGFQWKNYHSSVYLATASSVTGDERIFGEKTQLFVKTFDFSGRELVSFGEFTAMGTKMLRQGDTMFGISLPYDPHSVFAGDPERQRLYHCLNNKYVIEVYDRDGKPFRKIDRPYEPVPFTKEDAEDYWSGFEGNANKIFAEMARQVELPKVKTVTDRLLVDDLGDLWVETNETRKQEAAKLTAYDIFNQDGFYEARVWSAIRPGLFVAGKMYRMDEDPDTGIRTLKRYGVIWKR